MLLAVPNVSTGRDPALVAALGEAFAAGAPRGAARLLDIHGDPDHDRSVYTLAGAPSALVDAVLGGAATAIERIDLAANRGVHPHVGVLDVAPFVHLDDADRGAACAAALVAGDRLGRDLGLPVFLYGALAAGRARAQLRRGGVERLARRVAAGDLKPDFGPAAIDPRRGATLLAARPPLVAFNLVLAPPAGEPEAAEIAARIREGGDEGLPGLRAIGVALPARAGAAQVSINVEDHRAAPLAAIVGAVRRHADVATGELVGLAPEAAFAGFPDDLPIPGFDPARHLIERALAAA